MIGYRPKSLFELISKRHAGGGGRPGGKPTLNFKQKRILGLDKPFKRFKLRPFGDFDDHFEGFYNEAENNPKHIMINLGQHDVWKEPDIDYDVNVKKNILVSNLFGSHKNCGMLPSKRRQRGERKLTFGEKSYLHKKSKLANAK